MSLPKTHTLIVLADLGVVRAFRHSASVTDEQHLVEISVPGQPPPLVPLHEQVSDQAGRFPSGSQTGERIGMRHGESHGKTVEEERRQLRDVAGTIEQVVANEEFESWRLAAPKAINNRLIALLSEEIRERLVLNLHADLIKLPLREVKQRLLNKTASLRA